MNNRALLLSAATALVLALSGCACLQGMGGDSSKARDAVRAKYPNLRECDAQDCSVSVTATACDPASIKAAPDPLAVVKTHRGVLIVWTVDSPGYTFDRKSGIVLKDASQGQFKCKARSRATEYDCTNKNENASITEYQYSITLRDAGGRACTLDPIIINGY
ncbi:MAG TPA: hypothetical protein VII36_09455 [Usitatibacter sp.]